MSAALNIGLLILLWTLVALMVCSWVLLFRGTRDLHRQIRHRQRRRYDHDLAQAILLARMGATQREVPLDDLPAEEIARIAREVFTQD